MKKNIFRIFLVAAFIFAAAAGFLVFKLYGQSQQDKLSGILKQELKRYPISLVILFEGAYSSADSGQRRARLKISQRNANGAQKSESSYIFTGDVIQAQAVALNMQDQKISFFLNLFFNNKEPEKYALNKIGKPPLAFMQPGIREYFQNRYWGRLWDDVLDPRGKNTLSLSNIALDVPDSKFLKGAKYILSLDADGKINAKYYYVSNIAP